jgi:hypothetical protein
VTTTEVTVSLPRLHEKQQEIINTAKRFNVIRCGRRFGKTELAKELIVNPALDGFPVAYYAPTYKDLDTYWIEIKHILHEVIQTKNEQTKQMRLFTGGIIDMWSLEDPDSGRGRKYKRVVVDECEKAKKLEQAWQGTIRATLTDFEGDCWFLSTPKFGQTYFKDLYELFRKPDFQHEWMSWKFTTYDNPHINPKEIDAARRTMNELYFLCEYMADDVDLNLNAWAFAFDPSKHVSKCEIDTAHEVWLSFDFNRNPISCLILQHYDDTIFVPKSVKLPNSNIYALCDHIKSIVPPNALIMVTGDATGKGSSALVQDNLNYYTVIKQQLALGDMQLRVPSVNPKLEENQVLFNSLLSHYKWKIDPDNAEALIFDLKYVKTLPDGSIEKGDRHDPTKQSDILDCCRYFTHSQMKWFLNLQ